MHKAKKRFGQNFLIDNKIIDNIVAASLSSDVSSLIEIGPGQGALTSVLLNLNKICHVVEIDRDLVDMLEKKYSNKLDSQLFIHSCDVLKFDIKGLIDSLNDKTVIIGNLPYNISTPLLFKLFELNFHNIESMIFMLQSEVGKRLVASPDTKQYGKLSIMAQYYCDIEELFEVGPESFSPPPKVNSSVLKFTPKAIPYPVLDDIKLLQNIVQCAFNQRRKTVQNSLKEFLLPSDFSFLDIDGKKRAENLSISEYISIYQYLNPKN